MNKKTNNLSQEELKELQWEKLKNLLKVVLATNKFYKKKYAAVGVKSADDIKTWEDFKRLPFTTKKELLEDQIAHPPFGTNLTKPLEKYILIRSTSGATGQKLHTLFTEEDIERINKANSSFLWRKMMPVNSSDRIMIIFPQSSFFLATSWTRKARLMIIPNDERSDLDILKRILQLRVTIIQTYPSALFSLMELASKEGINLKRQSAVRMIVLGGEMGANIPSIRRKIEKQWGAKCYDLVGSVELSVIATECIEKNGPHLFEENIISEVMNHKNGKEELKGELIATYLPRYDYPFIRYPTGNYVELEKKLCSCGLIFPRLKGGILGRVDGAIKIRAVLYFPSEIEQLFLDFPEIKQFLVEVKKLNNEVDTVEIKIELPLSARRDTVGLLERKFVQCMGFTPTITVFPRGAFQKNQYIYKSRRIFDKRFQNSNEYEYKLNDYSLIKVFLYRKIFKFLMFKLKLKKSLTKIHKIFD
ncbi:MAG: hypothetical protein Q8P10_01280 [bacterium]|nr:hypothetical protein [bacterium]